MAISERLKRYLAESRVAHSSGKHAVVYTAQEIAAAQHISGHQLAKSVLVKTEQGPVLVVLPAVQLIDLKRLKAFLRAKSLRIAKEADIRQQFPDIEVGAMSPFGNLYNVPVVVDRSLTEHPSIAFNAGSHTDTITLRSQDFLRLVKPKVGAFGQLVGGPKKKKAKKPAAKRSARKPARSSNARPKAKKRRR